MFGHDDKDDATTKTDENAGPIVQPISTTPPDENVVGVAPAITPASAPVVQDDDDEDISKIVEDINATADENEATPESVAREDDSSDSPTLSETPAELVEVKKSALRELSPLLDELDQPAEEKLDILMMTIQATDDQALIPQAFETAKKIEDKKARAEAMLDIIQEINYFTKKQ